MLILSFWVTFWKNWADLAFDGGESQSNAISHHNDGNDGRLSYLTKPAGVVSDAELVERARLEFLANMNHDLRTPLNAVIGFAQIIENEIFGQVSPQYLEYAKHIQESGYDLLAKIEDMLELADRETAHAISERKPATKPARPKTKQIEKQLVVAD